MKANRFCVALSTFVLLCLTTVCFAQQGYKKPPKEVLDILHAPVTPGVSVSPTRDNMLLSTGLRYPPLADLAQPVLRIAGRRINPASNSPFRFQYSIGLTLKRIADGSEIKVETPLDAKISGIDWSEDGKHFAFLNTTANRVELWVGDAVTGKIRNLKAITVNSAVGDPLTWMPDNRTLLVQLVPANRGAAPATPAVPPEPNTQESSGRPGPVRTYEDLLKSPHDENLYEYYATSQLALVDSSSGRATTFGQPSIFQGVDAAPDGHHILVTRLHRPFSYLFPDSAFPRDIEVWDTKGKLVFKVASQPLADQVPINGVITGRRSIRWVPGSTGDTHLDAGVGRRRSAQERWPSATASRCSKHHSRANRSSCSKLSIALPSAASARKADCFISATSIATGAGSARSSSTSINPRRRRSFYGAAINRTATLIPARR
jgi:hypothetical protein